MHFMRCNVHPITFPCIIVMFIHYFSLHAISMCEQVWVEKELTVPADASVLDLGAWISSWFQAHSRNTLCPDVLKHANTALSFFIARSFFIYIRRM